MGAGRCAVPPGTVVAEAAVWGARDNHASSFNEVWQGVACNIHSQGYERTTGAGGVRSGGATGGGACGASGRRAPW